MPMALVKIKRSFLLKLTGWLQEPTLWGHSVSPGLVGQGELDGHLLFLKSVQGTWALGGLTSCQRLSPISSQEVFLSLEHSGSGSDWQPRVWSPLAILRQKTYPLLLFIFFLGSFLQSLINMEDLLLMGGDWRGTWRDDVSPFLCS